MQAGGREERPSGKDSDFPSVKVTSGRRTAGPDGEGPSSGPPPHPVGREEREPTHLVDSICAVRFTVRTLICFPC